MLSSLSKTNIDKHKIESGCLSFQISLELIMTTGSLVMTSLTCVCISLIASYKYSKHNVCIQLHVLSVHEFKYLLKTNEKVHVRPLPLIIPSDVARAARVRPFNYNVSKIVHHSFEHTQHCTHSLQCSKRPSYCSRSSCVPAIKSHPCQSRRHRHRCYPRNP